MILKITSLITIILFIGFNAAFAQPAISWGEEIIVADGATYGNVRPRIAVNGDGEPIVLFGKAPAGRGYGRGAGRGEGMGRRERQQQEILQRFQTDMGQQQKAGSCKHYR